jgi:hypothetical protein
MASKMPVRKTSQQNEQFLAFQCTSKLAIATVVE